NQSLAHGIGHSHAATGEPARVCRRRWIRGKSGGGTNGFWTSHLYSSSQRLHNFVCPFECFLSGLAAICKRAAVCRRIVENRFGIFTQSIRCSPKRFYCLERKHGRLGGAACAF